MFKKLIATVAVLALSTSAFAGTTTVKHDNCPCKPGVCTKAVAKENVISKRTPRVIQSAKGPAWNTIVWDR